MLYSVVGHRSEIHRHSSAGHRLESKFVDGQRMVRCVQGHTVLNTPFSV